MRSLLKILFILLVAVSLKPAAYHMAAPSDVVVVNTLDNGGVPVDDSMRAREQKVRIFPQYANQRQHYAADSRQTALLDRFSKREISPVEISRNQKYPEPERQRHHTI